MRWTTGMLLDNLFAALMVDRLQKSRRDESHGWGMGWAVAWNCVAKSYVVQQPPGAWNWAIGCIGEPELMSRPFDTTPTLPEGTFDSVGKPVSPQSLYLTQLAERLGLDASAEHWLFLTGNQTGRENFTLDLASLDAMGQNSPAQSRAPFAPVNTGNVREGKREFAGRNGSG